MSAGSRPAQVNPFAANALREIGFDSSTLYSKAVNDLPVEFVESLDYVITLCAEEVCPVVLSNAPKIHWPLPDPANRIGSDEEQMNTFRTTRDEIQRRLQVFQREALPGNS
jgi:arsenate reductase